MRVPMSDLCFYIGLITYGVIPMVACVVAGVIGSVEHTSSPGSLRTDTDEGKEACSND